MRGPLQRPAPSFCADKYTETARWPPREKHNRWGQPTRRAHNIVLRMAPILKDSVNSRRCRGGMNLGSPGFVCWCALGWCSPQPSHLDKHVLRAHQRDDGLFLSTDSGDPHGSNQVVAPRVFSAGIRHRMWGADGARDSIGFHPNYPPIRGLAIDTR